jgi:hypothetical protein
MRFEVIELFSADSLIFSLDFLSPDFLLISGWLEPGFQVENHRGRVDRDPLAIRSRAIMVNMSQMGIAVGAGSCAVGLLVLD